MSLIVEDGTGKSDADSYDTVANASVYHAAYGNTEWADAAEAAQEIAMRQAFRYQNVSYDWEAVKTTSTQSGAWPRTGATDASGYLIAPDAIPNQVKQAQYELALKALSESLLSDVSGEDKLSRVKVDVIEVEYSPATGSQKRYAMADNLLRAFVLGNKNVVQLFIS